MAPWEGIAIRTRFLVVDDDARRAADVQRALRPYPSIVARTISDADRAVREGGIVAVVLDEQIRGECPLHFVATLRTSHDRTPILVLLRLGDLGAVNRCHLVGARAVVREGSDANIELFAREVTHVPTESDVAAACATFARRYRLTAGQTRILQTLTRVSGYAAIARELEITSRTAETHVHRILAKAGIASREELIIAVFTAARDPTYVVPRMDRPSE